MISVCIPVYNHDVTELVSELHKQLVVANVPFEILLQDDGSTDETIRNTNKNIALSNVFYQENGKNLGRSVTRNKLAERAKMEYLLFIDNDMVIDKSDFIKHYLEKKSGDIIYGGVRYEGAAPDGHRLRWKYGKAIESQPKKNKNVIAYFSACNFLVKSKVFNTIKFDEELTQYGYEDTLYAKQALASGVNINCIENVVVSKDVISDEQFKANLKEAMKNLSILYKSNKLNAKDGIRLIQVYERLNRLGLVGITKVLIDLLLKNPSARLVKNYELQNIQRFKLREFLRYV